jgi:hypothetical protein
LNALRWGVVLVLVLAATGCSRSREPAPEPEPPRAERDAPLDLSAATVAPNPRLFERVNELELEIFERIWGQLDDPVRPENAVEQFAHAQAFLQRLSSTPSSRDGRPDRRRASNVPVFSPAMEERFGPAYVREWYLRVLRWRERNKPALMQRLGVRAWQADAILDGYFRVGSPWEYALVAWGSPSRILEHSGRYGSGFTMFYTNGKLRQVVVSDGIVIRVVE